MRVVDKDTALIGLLIIAFMIGSIIYNWVNPERRVDMQWGRGNTSAGKVSIYSANLMIIALGTVGIKLFCQAFDYQWNEEFGYRILGGAFALLLISALRDCHDYMQTQ